MQFSACGASSDDCCNGGCVDVFLTSVVSLLMVSIVLFSGEFVLFRGMGMGFKNKMMRHCYRKEKYQQF